MNKLIVITGGTKGIGYAVAEKFAREGFDIATCSRKLADLDKMKADFEDKYGIRVHVSESDLSDAAQTKLFADFVIGIGSPVEVLVNNAGYFLPGSVIGEKEGALESMISANLYSAYYLTRGLIKAMIAERHGHIFNMCSIASFMAYPNGGSYTISKFALLGFSKVLREELMQSNIRVTSIMPGATMSASWEGSGVAPERLMKASDIAETVFSAYSLSQNSVIEEIIIRPQLGDL